MLDQLDRSIDRCRRSAVVRVNRVNDVVLIKINGIILRVNVVPLCIEIYPDTLTEIHELAVNPCLALVRWILLDHFVDDLRL